MPPSRRFLETARLRLEPVEATHAEGLHSAAMRSRPELLPWMPWARQPSVAGSLKMAETSRRNWGYDREFHFAVVERSTGEILGVVGLNRAGGDAAELHYWIRSDRVRMGLATEACEGLIAWAGPALAVRRLTLWAGRENSASRRVAENLGFVHIGPLAWRPEGGLGTFDAEAYELPLQERSVPTNRRRPAGD